MLLESKMVMNMRNDNDDDGDVRADGLEDEDCSSIARLMVQALSSHFEHVLCINLWVSVAIPVTIRYPKLYTRHVLHNYEQTT